MRRNQHQSLVENREEEVKEKPLRIQDPFSERALTGKEIGASRSSGGRTGRGCFVLSSMKEACNRGELAGRSLGSGPGQLHTSNHQIDSHLTQPILAFVCSSNKGLGRLI